MSSKVNWLPLESNPEAINKFLRQIGIPEPTKCVDIYSFDDEHTDPVYALLFCFPMFEKFEEQIKPMYQKLIDDGYKTPKDMFFMQQHISNACGTFALFHAITNNSQVINIGNGSFKKWFDKATNLNEAERSKSLEEDATLADAHKDCAHAGDTNPDPDTVEHHFICYIHKDGQLYEIDSRAPFPRPCGPTSAASLIKDAGTECMKMMAAVNQVDFAAVALVG